MSHHHHHHHHGEGQSDFRLAWAIAANLGLTVVQIVGGVLAGSLSLVADALHNFNDAGSLIIAFAARRISRKPADRKRTFGYRRAETIGALINLITLVIVGVYLIYEAVLRFFQPEPIEGWIVVGVAGVALAVDVATAALTYAMSKESVNIRAAFVHNVSDAMASVGVIIAGTLILLYEWHIADLIATVVISGYILYQGFLMLPQVIHSLMEGVPEGLSLDEVAEAMESVEGVEEVHHLHVWELSEHHRALEAHVVVDTSNPAELERIKHDVKALCEERFAISHSTLELEWPSAASVPCASRVCA